MGPNGEMREGRVGSAVDLHTAHPSGDTPLIEPRAHGERLAGAAHPHGANGAYPELIVHRSLHAGPAEADPCGDARCAACRREQSGLTNRRPRDSKMMRRGVCVPFPRDVRLHAPVVELGAQDLEGIGGLVGQHRPQRVLEDDGIAGIRGCGCHLQPVDDRLGQGTPSEGDYLAGCAARALRFTGGRG